MGKLSCMILTISDSCSAGDNKDTSGPYLVEAVKNTFNDIDVQLHLISDDCLKIEKCLLQYCDVLGADLVITTGGTGFTQRDVTPEATRKIILKEATGIMAAINMKSLQITEMAMLSRGVSGIRNNTLIINFPGSLKAVRECYSVIKGVLPHALDQIRGDTCQVKATHNVLQYPHNVQQCPHNKNKYSDVNKVAYRQRESVYPMVSVEHATNTILKEQRAGEHESIPTVRAVRRVLCESVRAAHPFPPFPASTKDGYACVSEDGCGGRKVRGATLAGDAPPAPLLPGECCRISTGAPVPEGADCVVQVEDTKLLSHSPDGTEEYEIEVMVAPVPGQDIRPVGSDIAAGEEVLHEGTTVEAAELGVLCSLGVQDLKVFSRITVGILSSGNELQNPDEKTLRPGHIRDSNKSMLMALLRDYAECIDLGIAKDNVESLRVTIAQGFKSCDLIVTSGGVSMGERDLLKHVLLQHFNGEILFGRVNMKPGKPTVFIKCPGYGQVLALPGNPVSAFVTCHLFVIPLLRQRPWLEVCVRTAAEVRLDSRPEYARARFTPPSLSAGTSANVSADHLPLATLTGNQISSRLLSAVDAPLLLQLPPASAACPVLPAGSIVKALIIGKF